MGVNIIYRRDVIKGVAQHFRNTYANSLDGPAMWKQGWTKRQIADALDSMNLETCSPSDVSQVIGNDSWVENECDICGNSCCDALARLGDEPDYDARWVDVCLPCLSSILRDAQRIEAEGQDAKTGLVHESRVAKQCAPTD